MCFVTNGGVVAFRCAVAIVVDGQRGVVESNVATQLEELAAEVVSAVDALCQQFKMLRLGQDVCHLGAIAAVPGDGLQRLAVDGGEFVVGQCAAINGIVGASGEGFAGLDFHVASVRGVHASPSDGDDAFAVNGDTFIGI